MVSSLLAEMVPTWAIFSPVTGLLNLSRAPGMRLPSASFEPQIGGDSLVDAALEGHGVGTGGDVLHAFAEDGLGENGGGSGAVAGDVAGLAGDFLHHLGAHVLHGVLQLNFLGDGDAVLGNERGTEFLVDDDVAALGAEGDFHCVGENVDAAQNGLAGLFAVDDLLCHFSKSPIENLLAGTTEDVP